MKRITGLIIITALIMSIAACVQAPEQAPAASTATQTATPALTQTAAAPTKTVTPAPTATATPAPTATLTPAPTPSPTTAPKPKKTKAPAPPSGPVIIAAANNYAYSYGEIRGGYADGKWLSQSEAAAYCKGKMTFGEYDLTGLKGTVESSGVTYYEDDDCYYLDIPGVDDEDGGNADDDSSYYTYLYTGGKLADIEIVEDTEEACLAVQTMLDNALGEGEAEVEIWNAVSADIDNDGEKETFVHASLGNGEDFMDISVWGIIESDGTIKTIDDDYANSFNYYGAINLINIIDIDGDNISELVIDYCWGNDDGGMWVYKYDGNNFTLVLDYYVFIDPGT